MGKQKVVELDDYRMIWLTGVIECNECGRRWVGVYRSDGSFPLECPRCAELSGEVRRG